MSEELKRCDCGAAGLMRVSVRGFQCMCVNNATCGARTAWFDNDDDAERAWNRRAPSVTREEITRDDLLAILIRTLGVGYLVDPPYDQTMFDAGAHVTGTTEAADAILALFGGE